MTEKGLPPAAPGDNLRDRITPEYVLDTAAEVLALLNERQVEYVVVGGLAVRQYLPHRLPKDLDLILSIPEVKRLPEIRFVRRFVHFAHGFYQELPVDALLTSSPIFDMVRRDHKEPRPFAGQTITCASVEGLYLMKLYALTSIHHKSIWHKLTQAEEDLLGLLRHHPMALEPFATHLEPHLPAHEIEYLRDTLIPNLYGRLAGGPPLVVVASA